jgi:hypothetical protein
MFVVLVASVVWLFFLGAVGFAVFRLGRRALRRARR